MAMSLDAELEDHFLATAKRGRTAWLAGDIALAEHYFLESWDMIPEPKSSYDYAQTSSYGIAIFYRDTAQFEKARAWAMVAREIYGHGEASSEYMDSLVATIEFESGNLDAAYALFESQFLMHGRRAFEGHKKGFIDFIKSRKKAG
ncbi:hypothetical protein NJH49_03875 [Stenotrophomonas maltophilia]|uniref:hypothetical protein n=1 Tax=Stenotrophomonas maltophilia TaxID=40324 RepID=UPI0020984499|nr:hypothetical protein [Stenotrophomonas maltophilia]MCO7398991.1 hypothetical protein [Stenotrophomonas maltophilia]MCO7410523.1 hypothetical protein [Stenotrophomonas maltophilia]HDS1649258.1 hypothetical protein [Stenotrophomonas maltophilia]